MPTTRSATGNSKPRFLTAGAETVSPAAANQSVPKAKARVKTRLGMTSGTYRGSSTLRFKRASTGRVQKRRRDEKEDQVKTSSRPSVTVKAKAIGTTSTARRQDASAKARGVNKRDTRAKGVPGNGTVAGCTTQEKKDQKDRKKNRKKVETEKTAWGDMTEADKEAQYWATSPSWMDTMW